MNRSKSLVLLAGAALSLSASAALAGTSTDENRAYRAELLADAEQRTSQVGSGLGGGMTIADDGTGNNRIAIGGLVQFRYTANFRDDDVGENDDFTHGFSLPRTQLRFSGNLINPDFEFYVQGDFSTRQAVPTMEEPNGNGDIDMFGQMPGTFTLQDAFFRYTFENGMFVQAGQMKAPLLFEELVQPEYQLTADRSITNNFFSGGRTQGVALGYRDEAFSVVGVVNTGAMQDNTDFFASTNADIGLTVRGDFLIGGDWERFNSFTSWRGSDFASKIGGAIHWQTGGDTGIGTEDIDLLVYTLDASVEGDGWNAFAAFIGQYIDLEDDVNNFGLVAQGGIFVTEQAELFARYDGIFFDSDIMPADSDDNQNFITVGGNWYFTPMSHAAKLTGDVVIGLNETADMMNAFGELGGLDSRTGILGNPSSGEVAVRLQLSTTF